MVLEVFPVGPFRANCYLVGDEAEGVAALVDPGDEPERLLAALQQSAQQADGRQGDAPQTSGRPGGLRLSHILLTHGHLDHIGAVARLKEATGAEVCIHSADAGMLIDPRLNMSALSGRPIVAPPADRLLQGGEVIQVGALRIEVIHTPGHTPGSVCFLVTEPSRLLLLSGDTLFAGSIGRTDFPGGSLDEIMKSIHGRLLALPDDMPVYPGHEDSTTIGEERTGNPFLS